MIAGEKFHKGTFLKHSDKILTKGDAMHVEKTQIYKCDNCGMVVQIVEAGQGELVCCNVAMELASD